MKLSSVGLARYLEPKICNPDKIACSFVTSDWKHSVLTDGVIALIFDDTAYGEPMPDGDANYQTIMNAVNVDGDPIELPTVEIEHQSWLNPYLPVLIDCDWCNGTGIDPGVPDVPCIECEGKGGHLGDALELWTREAEVKDRLIKIGNSHYDRRYIWLLNVLAQYRTLNIIQSDQASQHAYNYDPRYKPAQMLSFRFDDGCGVLMGTQRL